jgi:hypothetical protein
VEGEEMFIESCRIGMHRNKNITTKAQKLQQLFFGEAQIITKVDKKKNSYSNKYALKISE